jgi:hypothetical protein
MAEAVLLVYAELRRLRHELKRGAGLDHGEIEGCPPPRAGALRRPTTDRRPPTTDHRPPTTDHRPPTNNPLSLTTDLRPATCAERRVPLAPAPDTRHPALGTHHVLIDRLWLVASNSAEWEAAGASVGWMASQVDIVARWADAAPLARLLAQAIAENPATLFDCYLQADMPPAPAELRAWREALPYQPGYLDRVAVYRRAAPEPAHSRISPRLWLVLPWTAQADPADYAGVAEIIWEVELADGETPPLGAWRAAGGAGVWMRGRAVTGEEQDRWSNRIGAYIWYEVSER